MYYYQSDALGSVRLKTDPNKTVVFSDNYQPFGKDNGIPVFTGTCETHRYTGKPVSQTTGLYYDYHRWYDPSIGRFISPDPKHGRISNPQSLNPYLYVTNNPTTLTDPTGEDQGIHDHTACIRNNTSCNGPDPLFTVVSNWWNGLTPQQKGIVILAVLVVVVVVTVVAVQPELLGVDAELAGAAATDVAAEGAADTVAVAADATATAADASAAAADATVAGEAASVGATEASAASSIGDTGGGLGEGLGDQGMSNVFRLLRFLPREYRTPAKILICGAILVAGIYISATQNAQSTAESRPGQSSDPLIAAKGFGALGVACLGILS